MRAGVDAFVSKRRADPEILHAVLWRALARSDQSGAGPAGSCSSIDFSRSRSFSSNAHSRWANG